MSNKKTAVFAIASCVFAIACFVLSHVVLPPIVKGSLFVVGIVLMLTFFTAIINVRKSMARSDTPDAFYNICMLAIALTFSLLLYYSDDITGIDVFAHSMIASGLATLTAFATVAFCTIVLFKPLRQHGSTFLTSCFTASCALIATLFYLFGDFLPASSFLDALRLFATVSSLSLALSLVMLEYDKRQKDKRS